MGKYFKSGENIPKMGYIAKNVGEFQMGDFGF